MRNKTHLLCWCGTKTFAPAYNAVSFFHYGMGIPIRDFSKSFSKSVVEILCKISEMKKKNIDSTENQKSLKTHKLL